ncbi:MAG TPA: proline--tRNA ligase [Acidimicrobiales bacterium]|nr:proline--tRNA ligase [Acidimicrobiales bacterium]
MAKSVLTPQATDFPRWYQDIVAKAELADNGPVRGTMVIRPYGYAIWERMQAEIDVRIKAAGVANAYFPLLIPESYLRREAEHVEGFSPELAVVTHGGGKKLEEPVVVRPTSETIINSYFAKWIQSYRDLPLLINQWANVVRWELRPRLFLRTTEFLWQEGHTAHASAGEAREFALKILSDVYEDVMVNVLAIPVLKGRKTDNERFAGATTTWTCEAMMRDAKALQMGTSHELGQNFARAFDITYLDESGTQAYVWQTSWGVSTRLMGALVMVHGDDDGLRLPPRLAPIQVVVILARADEGAADVAVTLAAELRAAGIRVELDTRTDTSFGRRVVDWELKGVPLRLEVGPRDLAQGVVVVARRDTGTKTSVPLAGVTAEVTATLDAIHGALLEEAAALQRSRTVTVGSLEEVEPAAASGFAVMPLSALGADGETTLNRAGLSVRCIQSADGGLPGPDDGDDASLVAIVGRAY